MSVDISGMQCRSSICADNPMPYVFCAALSTVGEEARWAWGMVCWTLGRPVTCRSVAGLWNPFSGHLSRFCSNSHPTGPPQWVSVSVCVCEDKGRMYSLCDNCSVCCFVCKTRCGCQGLGPTVKAWSWWTWGRAGLHDAHEEEFVLIPPLCWCYYFTDFGIIQQWV